MTRVVLSLDNTAADVEIIVIYWWRQAYLGRERLEVLAKLRVLLRGQLAATAHRAH